MKKADVAVDTVKKMKDVEKENGCRSKLLLGEGKVGIKIDGGN